MKQNSQRIDYLDIARGFAIFFVVLGHSFSGNNGSYTMCFVYSFHVMFFFIVSGALYAYGTQQNGRLPFKPVDKTKSLLLPYVFWGIILVVYYSVISAVGGASLVDELQSRTNAFLHFTNGPMWFLLAMFISQALFSATVYFKSLLIVTSCLLMGITIVFKTFSIPFPGLIGQGCVGFFFMAVGYFSYKLLFRKTNIFIVFGIGVIHLFLTFLNGTVSTAALTFNNPLLYIINACLGTWVLIQFCVYLNEMRIMKFPLKPARYWGKYSIIILCLHYAVIETVRSLDHKLFDSLLPRLGAAEGYILSLLVMGLLTAVMPILTKFFGWSFGLKKKK